MANSILGTRSPNGNVGVSGVIDSGELSMLSAGALSGFALAAVGGMNVGAGGVAGTQDVAVAKNTAGASDLLVGNGASMTFTLGAAPATSGQSRIDALVVWKDSTITSTTNNGLDAVGYQVVPGTAATTGSQQPPSEATIRASIPNGSGAFYAVIAYATVPYGATSAASVMLTPNQAALSSSLIPGRAYANALPAITTSLPAGSTETAVPISLRDASGFTAAGNTIIVPDGVHVVQVSGQVGISPETAGGAIRGYIRLGVGGTLFGEAFLSDAPATLSMLAMSPFIIPVNPGDVLAFSAASSNAAQLTAAFARTHYAVLAVG